MILTIRSAGNEFDFNTVSDSIADLTGNSEDIVETSAIRNIILNAYGDRLRYKHKNGINTVQVTLLQPARKSLYMALGALGFGILCGLVMRLMVPEMITNGVLTCFLNPVRPFLDGNMLQLIFLAVLVGVAVGMIGDYSRPLKELFSSCNELFLKITTMIVGVMPLAVFCSSAAMIINAGSSSILAVIQFCGVFVLALAVMICVYCLMISIIGRLNPLIFIKKYTSTMLTAFSLGSSNAAMPFNMETCGQLGISPRVSSFSIPLGATVNMDGGSIYLMIAGLFLARVFGVEIGSAQMAAMIVEIFILSLGAPGIPGSGLICLSVLLTQINVPMEALSLMIGIDSLMGMFRAASNVTGDVAVSLIVAKTENMLDIKKYKS